MKATPSHRRASRAIQRALMCALSLLCASAHAQPVRPATAPLVQGEFSLTEPYDATISPLIATAVTETFAHARTGGLLRGRFGWRRAAGILVAIEKAVTCRTVLSILSGRLGAWLELLAVVRRRGFDLL